MQTPRRGRVKAPDARRHLRREGGGSGGPAGRRKGSVPFVTVVDNSEILIGRGRGNRRRQLARQPHGVGHEEKQDKKGKSQQCSGHWALRLHALYLKILTNLRVALQPNVMETAKKTTVTMFPDRLGSRAGQTIGQISLLALSLPINSTRPSRQPVAIRREASWPSSDRRRRWPARPCRLPDR